MLLTMCLGVSYRVRLGMVTRPWFDRVFHLHVGAPPCGSRRLYQRSGLTVNSFSNLGSAQRWAPENESADWVAYGPEQSREMDLSYAQEWSYDPRMPRRKLQAGFPKRDK